MGIRDLKRYMRLEKENVLQPFKLRNTRLVIDGDNAIFHLWGYFNIAHQYGGDFDVYAEKCRYFIDILRTCNVEPFVVFSGGKLTGTTQDERMIKNFIDQKQRSIQRVEYMPEKEGKSFVPILAKETLINVLSEKNVPQVTCEFDADREIAILANRLACPVMSYGTNFYLFDLKGGLIPFEYASLAPRSEIEDSSLFVPSKLYTVEALAKDLAPNVLPVLSCILGNDYVNGQEELRQFYIKNNIALVEWQPEKIRKTMRGILQWLGNQENLATCIDNVLQYVEERKRESVKRAIDDTLDLYCNFRHFEGTNLEEFFATYDNDISLDKLANVQEVATSYSSRTNLNPQLLPIWFRIASSHCKIPGHILDVARHGAIYKRCQVEVIAERSTHGCSKSIREITYAIIIGQDSDLAVTEYDREKNTLQCFSVKPCRNIPGIASVPRLDTVPSRTREEMFSLLLASLELPIELLKDSMSDYSKYLIGVVTYWIRHSDPMVDKTHCYSALFGVIVLHARFFRSNISLALRKFPEDFLAALNTLPRNQLDDILAKTFNYFKPPKWFENHRRDIYLVHAFAQFQVCLKESLELNEVVMMPLKAPCPSLVLNNSFLYNFYRDLNTKKRQERAMVDILGDGSPVHLLFRDLLRCVEKVVDTFDLSMPQNQLHAKTTYSASPKTGPHTLPRHKVKTIQPKTETKHFVILRKMDLLGRGIYLSCEYRR